MSSVESTIPADEIPAKMPEKPEQPRAKGDDTDITSEVVIRSLMDLLVMPVSMIQPQERAFAADLLQQVVEVAGDEAKQALAERIAGMSEAPTSLVRWMLISFSDELLEPVLRSGACISDNDLVALVRSGHVERLRMIAGRGHLPYVACCALVEHGDPDAAVALLRNSAARIDEPTLFLLGNRAYDEPALREPLVMRPEMTPACALHVFWVLNAKLRAHVLRRFLTDCQVLPQVLVMARPGGDLIEGALRCARLSAQDVEDEELTEPAAGRGAVGALVAAVESGETADIAKQIKALGLASTAAAQQIADDASGEALAVACKAAGVSRVTFGAACKAWREHVAGDGADAPDAEQLQIVFDTLSFKQARMALTYWNWQASSSGPYAAFAGKEDDKERSAA